MLTETYVKVIWTIGEDITCCRNYIYVESYILYIVAIQSTINF